MRFQNALKAMGRRAVKSIVNVLGTINCTSKISYDAADCRKDASEWAVGERFIHMTGSIGTVVGPGQYSDTLNVRYDDPDLQKIYGEACSACAYYMKPIGVESGTCPGESPRTVAEHFQLLSEGSRQLASHELLPPGRHAPSGSGT